MALSYSRILCRKNLDGIIRQSLLKTSSAGISSTGLKCATVQLSESHADKNQRLKRPMSPHLTIYKPQLTTMLSITHRGTGMALSFYALGLGTAGLFVSGGVTGAIEAIDLMCLSSPLILLGKYAIAWPAMFHYFNGIRHLGWDLGQFLGIKQVYSTGWTVLAVSTISALALTAAF